jgi:pimeloyl-ACP methyl ester carboxylesterase
MFTPAQRSEQVTRFQSDDVEIDYSVVGAGEPVLLIHGFASTARVNWIDTGWAKTLADAGYRVITFDNRGHGSSGKLYDPGGYGAPTMAEDARRLLDHLDIARAHVMGYSMGARVAAFLAIAHPDRVRSLILAGLAANMIRGVEGAEEIAQALDAPSRDDVVEPGPRAFRLFAEQTKSDLKALAACMRSSRQTISESELALIKAPVLVVAGELDDTAGPVEPLVRSVPNARGLTLPRRNHMNAVSDKLYKQAVIEFLAAHTRA